MSNLSLYSTTAVIVLDSDGNRLLAKYFDPLHLRQDHSDHNHHSSASFKKTSNQFTIQHLGFRGFSDQLRTLKDQRSFERLIWDKTRKSSGNDTGDILIIQNHLVLCKSIVDVHFYVIGQEHENELMLQNFLNSFFDSVSLMLRNQVEKRSILENLDLVTLCMDEMVDDGIILETDSVAIASRVSRPKADVGVNLAEITINEQTIMQAFSSLRDKAAQKILQGSL